MKVEANRARARDDVQSRSALLLALVDRFRSCGQASEIAAAATEAVGRALGAARVVYGDVDPGKGEVAVEAAWADGGVEALPRNMPLEALAPGGAATLRAGLAAVLRDRDDIQAKAGGAVDRDAGPRSGIAAPVTREGRLRALLHVADSRPRFWSPDDVAFVEDVAARTWNAVEQARAMAVLRRNQARQGFLLVLGDRLRELDGPEEIKATVAEALGEHLRVNRVAYGEVSSCGDRVRFEAGWTGPGVPPPEDAPPLPKLGRDEVEGLERGLTATLDAGPHAAADARGSGVTFIAVPLIRDGRLRAVLALGARERRSWTSDDIALVGEVAARMWEALERVRAEIGLRELNATLESRVRQRTAELATSEARFRTLFENAPAAIVLIRVGPGDAVVYEAVNAEAERFMDRPASAIVGRDVSVAATAADPLLAYCRACAVTGVPVQYEASVEIARERRTAENVLAPLPVDGAGGQLLIGVSRDITAQRRAEDQLRQAQKMEAIGQLTGGIAHDFNNLLTGIIGSIALMQKRIGQGRTDTLGRYADLAMTSANRAAALTHRLLAFSRRQPLEAKPVDANNLVLAMGDLLRRTLGEAVLLDLAVADGLWPTLCDPHQLENAILNLAINARDAMPDGGRLTIATSNALLDEAFAEREPGVTPGPYVKLSVTDTGTGMPADVVARAFDPFFTTKPTGQGTGLGLSMIYGFVKQSNGYTRIASEVDHGTTVDIYLPLAGAADAETVVHDVPTPSRAAEGETVLVVEDDEAVRRLVLEVLSDLGYAALSAVDGPGGLDILRSDRRIDLLVTDVGLPGMNGRQLADAARTRRPELKVLFMTGYAENAAFGNAHRDPGLQLITKPFTVDGLAARIRAMIEQPPALPAPDAEERGERPAV